MWTWDSCLCRLLCQQGRMQLQQPRVTSDGGLVQREGLHSSLGAVRRTGRDRHPPAVDILLVLVVLQRPEEGKEHLPQQVVPLLLQQGDRAPPWTRLVAECSSSAVVLLFSCNGRFAGSNGEKIQLQMMRGDINEPTTRPRQQILADSCSKLCDVRNHVHEETDLIGLDLKLKLRLLQHSLAHHQIALRSMKLLQLREGKAPAVVAAMSAWSQQVHQWLRLWKTDTQRAAVQGCDKQRRARGRHVPTPLHVTRSGVENELHTVDTRETNTRQTAAAEGWRTGMYEHGSGTSCAHAHCTSQVRQGSCAPHQITRTPCDACQQVEAPPQVLSRHTVSTPLGQVESKSLRPATCCVLRPNPVPCSTMREVQFTSTHPRACVWAVQLRMQRISCLVTRHAARTAATAQDQTAAHTHT